MVSRWILFDIPAEKEICVRRLLLAAQRHDTNPFGAEQSIMNFCMNDNRTINDKYQTENKRTE